jgi:hypothetical protein
MLAMRRTGATLGETTLTPLNVNASQFGKLGAFKVDGAVYAQPLFLPAVEIPARESTMCSLWPRSTTACMPSTPTGRTMRRCGK